MSAVQDDAGQMTRLARTHPRGIVCTMDERYAETEESGLNAIELDPKEVSPYVTLASVYACVRQYKKMVGVLRRAIGVDAVALRAYLGDSLGATTGQRARPEEESTYRRGARGRRRYRTPSSVWLCHASPRGRQGVGAGAGDSAAVEPKQLPGGDAADRDISALGKCRRGEGAY